MSLLPFVIAAAEEPSKTPFFIIGGLLAVGAVVLSLVGMSEPAFPHGDRGARLIMALVAAMVVATILAATLTSK